MNLFASADDLKKSGFLFRITDNGGATADRFTIALCDGDAFVCSTAPAHPQGVGWWKESIDPAVMAEDVEEGRERDLRWIDLPERVRGCLLASLNRAYFDDARQQAQAIAERRKDAQVNEGGRDSFGKGLYRTAEGIMVRLDGPSDEDRGPYADPREALLNTLPQEYDMAGPEYHTTANLWEQGEPAPLWTALEEAMAA